MEDLRIQRLHIDEQLRSMGHSAGTYPSMGRERRGDRGYGSDQSLDDHGGYRGRGRGMSGGRGMPGRGRGQRGRSFTGTNCSLINLTIGVLFACLILISAFYNILKSSKQTRSIYIYIYY